MVLFWYFVLYSFFGFLLEVAFARVIRAEKKDRKCLLLLPLCPVYGLGALGILAAAELTGNRPVLLALAGGGIATAVEYLTGVFYARGLGVDFWDYTGLPMNLGGKICLPFSIAWGVLSLGLVYLIHPLVRPLVAAVPAVLTPAAVIFLLTDAGISAYLLKTTGDTGSLRWYDGFLSAGERGSS